MATLQKIRNRAGLLIAIVIGIALLAFILGDFMKSGKVAFSRAQMTIAKINGESVYVQEYDALVKSVSNFFQLYYGASFSDNQATQEARKQAWNELLNVHIHQKEYEKIGLAVHPEELFDVISGSNPHPIVSKFFSNPETNIFNRSALLNFLKAVQNDQVDENQKKLWYYLEDEIDKDRIRIKYNTLFNKGIFVTNLEARRKFAENNKKSSFSFITKSVASVADSLVSYTTDEIEDYYDDHINNYKNLDESRKIEFVTFEVVASKEDDSASKEWIDDIYEDFEASQNTEQFVNANSDNPYDAKNYAKDDLPVQYKDVLFDAPVGAVYGPYFENDAYKLAKLAKINYLPDSVRARHILLALNQNSDYNAAKAKADSLLELVKNGTSFGPLAEKNSDDKASAVDGGDLGWFTEGKMVKPFSDTCFNGNIGDIKLVNSEFGIHIVEITNQSRKTKKVQIGILEKKVRPSSETVQKYYTEAIRFASENSSYEDFTTTISDNPDLYSKRQATIAKGDYDIYGMENSRQIIQWAFLANINDVSQKVFEVNNNFIVAALTKINKKGSKPLKDVEAEIKLEIIREKKGEFLKAQLEELMNSGNDINSMAAKLGIEVIDAGETFFGNDMPMVRNAGLEPSLVALVSVTEEGAIAGPISGNNGVYVIQVNSITEPREPTETDLYLTKMRLNRNKGMNNEAQEALKEMSDITDNRANFF